MPDTLEGQPNTVLALFPQPASPYPWDPTLPSHLWSDPAAAQLVASGQGATLMTYFCWPGYIAGGVSKVTSLTDTFQVAASVAAAPNWPASIDIKGTQNFGIDSKGNESQIPMSILPTPLRQLNANEYIAAGPMTIPEVYETDTVLPSPTLGTTEQLNYLTPQNQTFILSALQALLSKTGATLSGLLLVLFLAGAMVHTACANSASTTPVPPQSPVITAANYVQLAAAANDAAAHELVALCVAQPGSTSPILDNGTCQTTKTVLADIATALEQVKGELASTDPWSCSSTGAPTPCTAAQTMKVKIANLLASNAINASVSNAALKADLLNLQSAINQILGVS